MKIHLISWCWNEEKLMPYFLKHYSQYCDLMTFYDDSSTDKTHEIIKSYPNTEIIIRERNTERQEYDEMTLVGFFNLAYKKDRGIYDWTIICGMDEFIYHPDLLKLLEKYKKEGITLPLSIGYNMFSKEFPPIDKQLSDVIKIGEYFPNESKCLVFNPEISMNYGLGMHTCNPVGNVKYSVPEIKVLHYMYLEHKYMIERRKEYYKQLSENNLRNGWGTHNKMYSEMSEEEYNKLEDNMIKVI